MSLDHIYKSKHSSYNWNIKNLGRIGYGDALELQNDLWQKVKNGSDHYLLLLEHEPVITLGRRTDPSHLLKNQDELKDQGIELFDVERGGSATYHGPGQLVGYLICKSSRMGGIHELVSNILQSLNQTVQRFGVKSKIDHENPGIWTDTNPPRKLAAVGMQNKKGVTLHGFAINIDMPLSGFAAIVPCGLTLPVSTVSIELEERISINKFKSELLPILLDNLDTISTNI